MKGLRTFVRQYKMDGSRSSPSCGSMLCTIISLVSSSFTKFYDQSVNRHRA